MRCKRLAFISAPLAFDFCALQKNLLVFYVRRVKQVSIMDCLPRQSGKSCRCTLCGILLSVMFCFVCAATAQDEPPPSPADVNLNQVFQDGMNAFQVGDYQKAVTNLENLIAQAAQETAHPPIGDHLAARGRPPGHPRRTDSEPHHDSGRPDESARRHVGTRPGQGKSDAQNS